MMLWGYGYGWPMMLWMFFWNLFWIALVGLAIWALLRWLMTRGKRLSIPPTEPSAMEILRQRYARGEIDTATFEQMREHLESRGQQQQVGSV